jgi:hypothetical protein
MKAEVQCQAGAPNDADCGSSSPEIRENSTLLILANMPKSLTEKLMDRRVKEEMAKSSESLGEIQKM